ncbi:MAG: UTP--glucose-1-phosphate uridylyltransferase [Kiritimatiellia bacterium]
MSSVLDLICSEDPACRDRDIADWVAGRNFSQVLEACAALDRFRRSEPNLYRRVRALFLLHALYRYHLPEYSELPVEGRIPYATLEHLMMRRFEEAVDYTLAQVNAEGIQLPLASALATVYQRLAFQSLADQVRKSVRSVQGNQWMFRLGHPLDQTLRIRPELCQPSACGLFPVLCEKTPVRMDLTHSGWSDVFFLGMDYPEGAKVINVSVDLAVKGRDPQPKAPVEVYLRVIDEPLLRLASVDLGVRADIHELSEVYDFARDYLGLLKAAIISSGLIPPGMEGSGQKLSDLLAVLLGPGRGLEIVSHVNGIPKGSRLAVSTNLLASLIAVCMRATGQTASMEGPLSPSERRIVASRAILGEWLGGSGGGWQDSGGVWPGIKLIEGAEAGPEHPEFGISKGRLLPEHRILDREDVPTESRRRLQESLILVHGGMAQNVGPILEMVTEKYLLRSAGAWRARQEALSLLQEVLDALREGDIRKLGAVTTRNFRGPLQEIIPWASNHYTERLIAEMEQRFGEDFWGFWMLGGMSGGGMGFMVAPEKRGEAVTFLQEMMLRHKKSLEHALPFAMDPVVYDFAINEQGTCASCLSGEMARMPVPYYAQMLPGWVRMNPRDLSDARRAELRLLSGVSRQDPAFASLVPALFDHLLPPVREEGSRGKSLPELLREIGFDPLQQEEVRQKLQSGHLGLSRNRMPLTMVIEDVQPGDVQRVAELGDDLRALGEAALRKGEVGVITLAAGTGSRWTQGAGVVKGLHPFCKLAGRHRSFVELHLAKSRKVSQRAGIPLPHVFTTSYLTHEPIRSALAEAEQFGYPGPVKLSKGSAVGIRMVPMLRDLSFAWEEMPQQLLDEQAQKMKESLHQALSAWAEKAGEGSDYTDNLPMQCLHPVGHWFELPGLLRNGVLAELLAERPQLRWLMLHNVDTTGADVDAVCLGQHIASGKDLSFEVIPRQIQDSGGGLGRVNGRVQLVEGLALPTEALDMEMRYYNSNTTWIDLEALFRIFGLNREDLNHPARVAEAVRRLAARLPTYITLKEVKKRWGHGQEDVFPVSQYEKLWTDMTRLPDVDCGYLLVDRLRGQQLKDPAQLDSWVRDGSAAYVEQLCDFGDAPAG